MVKKMVFLLLTCIVMVMVKGLYFFYLRKLSHVSIFNEQ